MGKNTKVPSSTPCLIEGISVNHCLVHPRGSAVPVIVMNQNNYNVWIQQPLLAAEIYWVEHLPWDYGVELHHEGENIEVAFQPLTPGDSLATVETVHDEPDTKPLKEANKEPHPKFGPCPNTNVADFDFQKEVECLPFKLNLGDIHLDKEHQAKFIDLIYIYKEDFSLHDEDLGYCDKLTHTIPTSTNKPVYLPHRKFLCNFWDRCANALTPGFAKGSFDHLTLPMPPKLLLSKRNLGRSVSVWTIGN